MAPYALNDYNGATTNNGWATGLGVIRTASMSSGNAMRTIVCFSRPATLPAGRRRLQATAQALNQPILDPSGAAIVWLDRSVPWCFSDLYLYSMPHHIGLSHG